MRISRREWLALIAATPVLRAAEAPAAPVAIARCKSYTDGVTERLNTMFDQLGGLGRLVKNKTVTVKLNLTGSPGTRLQGKPPAQTHYTHPTVIAAFAHLAGNAGARRIRFVESAFVTAAPLEEFMMNAGWNVRQLKSAAPNVEFENTNFLGLGKKYSRLKVPNGGYLYSAYDLNHSFEDTDVFVSMAKLKDHETCGVTLSLKNCFGNTPASIYGDDAGVDEPNEKPGSGRVSVFHEGKRAPSKSAPQELHPSSPRQGGYRVPRIVADLCAARPIDLAIIDGVESMAGGEGPWIQKKLRLVQPGLLLAGTNPVNTDAVASAVMGYNPTADRGTRPFETCDNTMLLAERHGLGSTDLKRIEVRGLSVEQALFPFSA